jgi:F0F1-type ATP synthase membrane subunit c/vacuolar-type H+-ATPase subunit K
MTSVLSIALAWAAAAIAIAIVGHAWLTGISRNPEAAKSMFTPGIIALALAEFVALLSFVIALIK